MAEAAQSTTQEWRLPKAAKPPLIGELVERIEEAVAIARASEAAVMTVGAAALDAAEQAKRAADLAERASAATLPARSTGRDRARPPGTTAEWRPRPPASHASEMDSFDARADRVAERLRRLQRLPLSA